MSWYKFKFAQGFGNNDDDDSQIQPPIPPIDPLGEANQPIIDQPIINQPLEEPVDMVEEAPMEEVPLQEGEVQQVEVERAVGQTFNSPDQQVPVSNSIDKNFVIPYLDTRDYKKKIGGLEGTLAKLNEVAKKRGYDPIRFTVNPEHNEFWRIMGEPSETIELKDKLGNISYIPAARVTISGDLPLPQGSAFKKVRDENGKLVKDKNGKNVEEILGYKIIASVDHYPIREPAHLEQDAQTGGIFIVSLPQEIASQHTNRLTNIQSKIRRRKDYVGDEGFKDYVGIPVQNETEGKTFLAQNGLTDDLGEWKNTVDRFPGSPKIDDRFWFSSPLFCEHCRSRKRGLTARAITYVANEYDPDLLESGQISQQDILKGKQSQLGTTCVSGQKNAFNFINRLERLKKKMQKTETKARKSDSYGGKASLLPKDMKQVLAHINANYRSTGRISGWRVSNYLSYLNSKNPRVPTWGVPTQEDYDMANRALSYWKEKEPYAQGQERNLVHLSLQNKVNRRDIDKSAELLKGYIDSLKVPEKEENRLDEPISPIREPIAPVVPERPAIPEEQVAPEEQESNFVGEVGQPILTRVKILSTEKKHARSGNAYYLVHMEDPNGNKITSFFFQKEDPAQTIGLGNEFNFYGKVEKHVSPKSRRGNWYNDQKGGKSTTIYTVRGEPTVVPDEDVNNYKDKAGEHFYPGRPAEEAPVEDITENIPGITEDTPIEEEAKEPKLNPLAEYVKMLGDEAEKRIIVQGFDPEELELIPAFLGAIEKKDPSFRGKRKIYEKQLQFILRNQGKEELVKQLKNLYKMFD